MSAAAETAADAIMPSSGLGLSVARPRYVSCRYRRMRTPLIESPAYGRRGRLAARRRMRRRVLVGLGVCAVVVGVLAAGAWATGWRPTSLSRSASASSQATETATPHELGSVTPNVGAGAGASQGAAAPAQPGAAPATAVPAIPAPATPATITVAAVGDMIFDRRVKSLVAAQGGLAPLAKVASRLRQADVTVGNLESNLSTSGSPQAGKDVTFRGHPAAIKGLAASGFDFVALANNHVLDYGSASLKDTLEALDSAGIGHAGAGMDRSQAWKPAVVERNGATVAFLSFSHILPAGFVATDSKAGLARGRGNMDAVADAIAAAKREYDYVAVSFHWGVEYKDFANADQVRDARRAVDAGADLVLSHHPHVIQGIEFYKRGLIAYSLGDFVFDHYSRKTGEAFILDLELGPAGVANATATPVYLNTNGAPAVVKGSEASAILKRLATISAPHGTTVSIAGDTARVTP